MVEVQRKQATYRCPLCDRTIVGVHSITRHRQNMKKHPNDISRCDNVRKKKHRLLQGMSLERGLPSSTSDEEDFHLSSDNGGFLVSDVAVDDDNSIGSNPVIVEPNDPIVEPMPEPSLAQIVRRAAYYDKRTQTSKLLTRTRLVDKPAAITDKYPPSDMTYKQHAWSTYIATVYDSCSRDFWSFFLPMHHLAATAIDIALAAAKEAFMKTKVQKNFPLSKRSLMETKIAKIPAFWPLVMCTATIDLRSFDVPERFHTITFRFVDPVWGWICAAEKQPADTMQWIPKCKVDPAHPHDYYYGEGVQFGENFAQACRTCPVGTFPMCVSLHWDGAHAHGLWATPICVGVANTNSLHPDTKFCIAYMPVLTDMGGQHEGDRLEIKNSIRSQCISAILSVLEKAARSGVVCKLPSIHGGDATIYDVNVCSKNIVIVPKDVIAYVVKICLRCFKTRFYYHIKTRF